MTFRYLLTAISKAFPSPRKSQQKFCSNHPPQSLSKQTSLLYYTLSILPIVKRPIQSIHVDLMLLNFQQEYIVPVFVLITLNYKIILDFVIQR